jgi:hypothetical protein
MLVFYMNCCIDICKYTHHLPNQGIPPFYWCVENINISIFKSQCFFYCFCFPRHVIRMQRYWTLWQTYFQTLIFFSFFSGKTDTFQGTHGDIGCTSSQWMYSIHVAEPHKPEVNFLLIYRTHTHKRDLFSLSSLQEFRRVVTCNELVLRYLKKR